MKKFFWFSISVSVVVISFGFAFVGIVPPISISVTAGAGELTAEDYIEIQQLYVQYAHTLDLGDAEGWADTFTEDGVFGEAKGRTGLVDFAKGFFDRGGSDRHWNSQVLITPTAEGADGSCYLLLIDTSVQPVGITVSGIYTDKIVKTPNGWRFKNRIAKLEMPSN